MRKLLFVVLGAAVYAGSFITTLKIIDHQDSKTATKLVQATQPKLVR